MLIMDWLDLINLPRNLVMIYEISFIITSCLVILIDIKTFDVTEDPNTA